MKKRTKASCLDEIIRKTLIMAIIMTTIGMILNLVFSSNIFVDCLFLLFWIWSLLNRKKTWGMTLTFMFLIFVFLPYNWVNSSGVQGAMPYYSILFIAVISVESIGWKRKFYIISLMIVQLMMILYDSSRFIHLKSISFIFVAVHLSVLTGGMAIFICSLVNAYNEERDRNVIHAKSIEKHSQLQMYSMRYLEKLNTKLKSERHDYNNHLSIVYGLIMIEDYYKTREYLNHLLKNTISYRGMIDIPYSVLRVVLNYKLTDIESMNIELDIVTDLPNNLKIDEFEVGLILGNLIDNAIEALSLVENNRIIELSIVYKPDYLVIRSKNNYNGKIVLNNDGYQTTKNDATRHGFGLKKIKEIVEKNNGLMSIDHSNQMFVVDIALLVKK